MDASALSTLTALSGLLLVLVVAGRLIAALAIREGVALALLVALGLRLVVMLATHIASGDGFLFTDDAGYARTASGLADAWSAGNFADPTSHEYAGSRAVGFPSLVAWAFIAGDGSLVLAKSLVVLCGATLVVPTAILAKGLFGESAGRAAAWGVALCPTLIWWSSPLLKESVVALLLMTALVCVLRMPSLAAVGGLILSTLALVELRLSAAIAVAVVALLRVLPRLAAIRDWRRWRKWIALIGPPLAGGLFLVTAGDPLGFPDAYRKTVEDMVDDYGGVSAIGLPVDLARSFVAPYPWVFDADTANWYRALYPGMWLWYAALPLAASGIWRLRRRLGDLLVLLVPILVLLTLTVGATGFVFRQRSGIEALVVVLAVIGVTSWRQAGRLVAGSYLLVAVLSTAQSGSAVPGGAALTVSALALWLSTRTWGSNPDVLGAGERLVRPEAGDRPGLPMPDTAPAPLPRLGVWHAALSIRSRLPAFAGPSHGLKRPRTALSSVAARLRGYEPIAKALRRPKRWRGPTS